MFICTHQILGTFQETSKFSSRIKKPYRKENPETIHPQFLKNTDPFASRQQHVACIRTRMHKYSEFDTGSVGTNVNYTDAGYNARSWTQLAPIRVVNNVETGRKCVTR